MWVSGRLSVPSDGWCLGLVCIWGLWLCSYYWRWAVGELGPGVALQVHPSVLCSSGVDFVLAGSGLRCSGVS